MKFSKTTFLVVLFGFSLLSFAQTPTPVATATPASSSSLTVFKTIKLGFDLLPAETKDFESLPLAEKEAKIRQLVINKYFTALDKAGVIYGFEIVGMTKDPNFTVSKTSNSIDIYKFTVGELGTELFSRQYGASQKDFFKRAKELGAGVCPAEVALALRLQYTDQPDMDMLRIATSSFKTQLSSSAFLMVGRWNSKWKPWIFTYDTSKSDYGFINHSWIFCKEQTK